MGGRQGGRERERERGGGGGGEEREGERERDLLLTIVGKPVGCGRTINKFM